MKSIRSKFLILTLIAVLLSSFVIGGISLFIFTRSEEKASNRIMNLTCSEQGEILNANLSSVRNAVKAMAKTAQSALDNIGDLSDPEQVAAHEEDIVDLADTISRNIQGVVAYYVYFRPDRDSAITGFYYTWSEKRQSYVSIPSPAYYDEEGNRLAGNDWFDKTVKTGLANWLEPHYNGIINNYLVPYVYPLYKNGVVVGVAGMDVNFSAIAQSVQRIKPYETGEAFLVSDTGKVYYHPKLRKDSNLAKEIPDLEELVERLPKHNSLGDDESVTYRFDGTTRKLVYSTLENGMNLLLSADTEEINATRYGLSRVIAATAALFSLLSLIAVFWVSSHITRPLAKLTKAADEIAQGNLEVELPPPGKDEVGILANSFAVTTSYLKEYVTSMNNLAYLDHLTGVKNKAAFDMAQARLQKEIDSGIANFGILVADMNNLKKINDDYGHERGDEYLRAGCHMICDVFRHSPVFRIGGDEFAVVLERDDKRNCQQLLEELDRRMQECASNINLWERPSIAVGTAFCGNSDRKVDAVFIRADMAMYDDKRRMKGETVR